MDQVATKGTALGHKHWHLACLHVALWFSRGGRDLSVHSIYLFMAGTSCISSGDVRLHRPFASLQVGRVQMPSHLLQLSWRGFTQRISQPFISEHPRVYWRSPDRTGQSERKPGIVEKLAHCAELANANQALEKCSKLWLIQQKGRKKSEYIKKYLSSLQAVWFVYSYEGHWEKQVEILLVSFFFTLREWLGSRVWFEERNPRQYNLDD